jgi:biotin carboxyl carrier protein
MKFVATIGGEVRVVDVTGGGGRYRIAAGDRVWEVDSRATPAGIHSLLVDGVSYVADVTEDDGVSVVDLGGERYEVRVEEETRHVIRTRGGAGGAGGAHTLKAPLPGRVTHVSVKVGDTVKAGDPLLVIEAMKMENEFRATAPGTVAEVRVEPGQAVNAGDVLLVVG